MKTYKFIGILGKSKYYLSSDGWVAKAYRNKFTELGYIEDNLRTYKRLLESI